MAFRRLIYFKETLKFQLETLSDYFKESSENLKLKQGELDRDLKGTLAVIDDSEVTQNIIDNFLDENLKYFNDFPSYLNESSFLIVYSFFETNLARTCKYTRLDLNSSRGTINITAQPASSYIQDSKKYLSDVCRLPLKSKDAAWKKLDKLRDFRNFIAHNDLDLKQTKNPTDKARKRNTVNYINRVFGKCIDIDDLEKCKINNDKLIAEVLLLVETYLFFVIDKGLKKAK